MKKNWLFFVGLFFSAIVIGLLTGLSYSPVVATIIPLVFALITAGGSFFRSKTKESGAGFPIAEPAAYGAALVLFSLGFLSGTYTGVLAKLHWKQVWFGETNPALTEIKFKDFRLLAVSLELEERMTDAGIEQEKRKEIFESLLISLEERESARVALAQARRKAIAGINSEEVADFTNELAELSSIIDEIYNESEDFSEERYQQVEAIVENLNEVGKIGVIEEIEMLEYQLSEAELNLEKGNLLSEEEIDAIKPLIPNYSQSLKSNAPFRAIASDENRIEFLKDS